MIEEIYKDMIEKVVQSALEEDIPFGDITTDTLIDDRKISVRIIANDEGIFCGEIILKMIIEIVGNINIEVSVKDGHRIVPDNTIIELSGSAKNILKVERTLLNFISLLSGIATVTRSFVEKLSGSKIVLKDTRKTIPNLRILEKYAVKVGGGRNHRMHLSEFPLVKDNHIYFLLNASDTHIKQTKRKVPNLIEKLLLLNNQTNGNFEIEIQDLKILEIIFKYNIYPWCIMFDNLSLCDLQEGIKMVRKQEKQRGKRIFIELSGGINLDNISEYINFDVDFVSVGAITKIPRYVDFSVEVK